MVESVEDRFERRKIGVNIDNKVARFWIILPPFVDSLLDYVAIICWIMFNETVMIDFVQMSVGRKPRFFAVDDVNVFALFFDWL